LEKLVCRLFLLMQYLSSFKVVLIAIKVEKACSLECKARRLLRDCSGNAETPERVA
jgi:hypothetical protein